MEELSKIKQGIKTELLRMEEDCVYSSKSHFNCADFLRKLYYIIGIPLVILTAITTKYCIEIITLSAFILSAIQVVAVFIHWKNELMKGEKVFSNNIADHEFKRWWNLFNVILDYAYYPMAIYMLMQ